MHWVAPSLYLQIRPQGTRSWLFRYSRNGENQWMGLGAAGDSSVTINEYLVETDGAGFKTLIVRAVPNF